MLSGILLSLGATEAGGLGGAFGFFFLNIKSAIDCDVIPVSFDISLKRVEMLLSSDGFISLRAGRVGNKNLPLDVSLLSMVKGGFVDMIDVGGGGAGLGITIGLSSGMTGLIGTIIGSGAETGLTVGTDTFSSPITLALSLANTGNTTGSLILIGVPKLGADGVGLKPPDDCTGDGLKKGWETGTEPLIEIMG
jgi:hypothetical protein